MRNIFHLLVFWLTLSTGSQGFAKIETKVVKYKGDAIEMKGFHAFDSSIKGPRPAILVVHEWWGQNDYARRRAKMLAKLGYNAFAIDMYGDGKTAGHPKEAGKFSSMVFKNLEGAKARFQAAYNYISKDPLTAKGKIAAIGYCFGGGVVLHMARMGMDLDGVVSFHGSLASKIKPKPGTVKAKVLVLHGASDKFIKDEDIKTFKQDMKTAKVKYEFVSYPEALHSFTSKDADALAKKFNLPIGYQEKEDKQSWRKMQSIFKQIF